MTLPALFERHPPPWRVVAWEEPDESLRMFHVRDARGELVQTFAEDDEAIARLLAAAPGLVEALDGIEAHHVELNRKAKRDEARSLTLTKARAALAALAKEEA